MPSTTETRKSGDTLILSGTLDQTVPFTLATWVGATAKLNIADANTLAVIRDHAAVALDTTALPVKYSYSGAALLEGVYLYEIEVTFADATVLTWPNDGSKNKLKVLKELA